ncbi:MAG: 2-hydroxyacyl-CoA dehydratase [Bacteroidales bacterium]|nr:2-hydroxyacyl-CoA dehydratase [Bacteroidales bacterium]
MLRIGLDIGSTTAKIVVTKDDSSVVYHNYKRHNARMLDVVLSFLNEVKNLFPKESVTIKVSGSIGMGFSEQYNIPFVQEVVAASKTIKRFYPTAKTMIDIGGEDAKIVFFNDGNATDLRMNGNCAGGTGAFIDQMAILLGISISELNDLALKSNNIYPIASRCGVFSKTDIQNLIAKNISREDIAVSVFHAVAVQTISTLAHGIDIKYPIIFCGGPLTFLSALQKAFKEYLSLNDTDIITSKHGELTTALGTALTRTDNEQVLSINELINVFSKYENIKTNNNSKLEAIFKDENDFNLWQSRISNNKLRHNKLTQGSYEAFIGIDSGSTTTKIVVINNNAEILFTFYKNNKGKPIETVKEGLDILHKECLKSGTTLLFKGSCSTGYGEDLMKAAFKLNDGIVETMAHYMAARHLDKDVSFILDIGGQDMKAIFVNKGIIERIEINEACSSGCGSFIETFAKSLNYSTPEFAQKAINSKNPCDLGTRCTVFMNSKVKQVLREGTTIEDISAGLSYSVVKNCLYKVLKLKDISALGNNIVVQGGIMRNDSIVRALEILCKKEVTRCVCPELMGAFGCALSAKENQSDSFICLDEMLQQSSYSTQNTHCKGCENNCSIQTYKFKNEKTYFSGNRCEKYFSNSGVTKKSGRNMYEIKNNLIFSRHSKIENPLMTIGIPRALNMYEEYPFWHSLFSSCNINVVVSDLSNFTDYERNVKMVMSDNICFPAKLVHSHIENLQKKTVDRIFMPFVIYENESYQEQNSYNCPIVTAYSTVVKNVQSSEIPIDSPTISFKNRDLLFKQCSEYLLSLGVKENIITKAFEDAEQSLIDFRKELTIQNRDILNQTLRDNELTILLAGRPYHSDPLIQHKISNMLADMGINVITEDIIRDCDIDIKDTHFLSQWSYPNRIMKSAKWCTTQNELVQFVQMTSFGCGPDAFFIDEIRDLLLRNNRTYTLLKLDDINNIGSMKLRVRSLIESLKMSQKKKSFELKSSPFKTTPIYDEKYKNKKIIIPFFTSFISPLIPAAFSNLGFEVHNLPLSDELSADWGLKFANNEVCYPATLVVGDVIKAFKEGRHNPDDCVVCITQTGGQCRASNYLPLLKKALIDAGYGNVPIISFTFDDLDNNQPAFKINWFKLLKIAIPGILYSDCISKYYYASVVRENKKGAAIHLRDKYLILGAEIIRNKQSHKLYKVLSQAVEEFNAICQDIDLPKVGVVGEIYLKHNSFAQRNICDWLTEQKIEIVPPLLLGFFTQFFVNKKVNQKTNLEKSRFSDVVIDLFYRIIKRHINKVNIISSQFKYYIPFNDIFEEAREASNIITLSAQFGEGWLLPAEIVSYINCGVNNVVSLQPFGCIANHIISKGIEKKLKNIYPDINLLSLDFDSGVSDVNIKNRLLLFVDKIKGENN